MSRIRTVLFASSASWIARFSTIFLFPVLMRVMDREEFGTWLVIGNSTVFLGLLNFGLTPTLIRHIALAKGRSGADPNVELSDESIQHIADLVATGRTIFRWLAATTSIPAFLVGWRFLNHVEFQHVDRDHAIVAWLIVCIGYGVSVWFSYLECWMTGIGYLARNASIVSSVAVGTLIANIGGALLGGGLITLACILVTASLAQRALMVRSLHRHGSKIVQARGQWHSDYARKLIPPAIQYWLYALGYFLAVQTGAYFIIRARNAADVPAYQAGNSLLVNLQALACIVTTTSTVYLSQAWQAGNYDWVRRQTIRFAQIGMVIMAGGVAFALVAGREFIELWLGPGTFVGYEILIVFCIAQTIEAQGIILQTCARSTEDERYAISMLSAGALNLILCWTLIGPLGLLGVALSSLIAQLLTNYWYAIYRPMVRLSIDFRTYLRRAGLLWLATFGIAFLANFLLVDQLRTLEARRIWIVAASAAVTSLTIGAAFWWGIFELSHRQLVLSTARRWLNGAMRRGPSEEWKP